MFADWEELMAARSTLIRGCVLTLLMAGVAPQLEAAQLCASADEAEAFRLRHLQSRLMVAGLSCGQKDAYNSFVIRHKPELGGFGPRLVAYYQRSGGQAALNRYVTDLANAAASIRSDDPAAFCNHTWAMFWELEQNPDRLRDLAAANPVPAVSQPALCSIPPERPTPPAQKKTAAPKKDAAVKQVGSDLN
jgi:hypothetical protein